MKRKIAYITPDVQEAKTLALEFSNDLEVHHFDNPSKFLTWLDKTRDCEAILDSSNPNSSLGLNLIRTVKHVMGRQLPVIWLSHTNISSKAKTLFLKAGVSEIFSLNPLDKKRILTRLEFLAAGMEKSALVPYKKPMYSYHIPATKRAFDIAFALAALLCLSPLFLLIAILIKLESKGPVFYYSYRVGTGYRIFRFWKFRSMRQDADQLLLSMKDLNQYQPNTGCKELSSQTLCSTCATAGLKCQNELIDSKGNLVCENLYQQYQKAQDGAPFVKIANDPRVTRIGSFIRNTSIDELPQLYNVLRGDMSIVGNRPLPLYEAEKITTDKHAARFIAPAGITGLWQVSKRGKGDMSAEERKALDVEYAESFSLRRDMEIILKTFPALFQKENV